MMGFGLKLEYVYIYLINPTCALGYLIHRAYIEHLAMNRH